MTKPRSLRALLVLTLLFVLGGATGVFGTLAFVQRREAKVMRGGGPHFEERRVHGLSRRLDLDDEQQAKLREILRKNREEMRQLGKDMMDRCGEPLREHQATFDRELRTILRPEQVQRFDALKRERPLSLGPPGEFGPPPPWP